VKRHFDEQIAEYGPQYVVNLLSNAKGKKNKTKQETNKNKYIKQT